MINNEKRQSTEYLRKILASNTTDMYQHPKYIRSSSNQVVGEKNNLKMKRAKTDNSLNKIYTWSVDM